MISSHWWVDNGSSQISVYLCVFVFVSVFNTDGATEISKLISSDNEMMCEMSFLKFTE